MSGSLLDLHSYSKEAMDRLYSRLREIEKPYLQDKFHLIILTGFLTDIFKEDHTIRSIIEEMDKLDEIRADKSKLKIEKMAETWLKKVYFRYLYKEEQIYRVFFRSFVKNVIQPNTSLGEENLVRASNYFFDRYKDKYKKKLYRAQTNSRLQELQIQYPKFNILDAFAYGMILDKFKITDDDIRWFESILLILQKDKKSSKKVRFISKKF